MRRARDAEKNATVPMYLYYSAKRQESKYVFVNSFVFFEKIRNTLYKMYTPIHIAI